MASTTLPRVRSAKAGESFNIVVNWSDDTAPSDINLAGWIKTGSEVLAPLKRPGIFATAAVGEHGSMIYWGDPDGDLAIDAVHLHRLAQEQEEFTSTELAEWQERLGISNVEAASVLGIAVSTFSLYKAGSDIPAAVAIACRASLRDPVIVQARLRPSKPTGRPRRMSLI